MFLSQFSSLLSEHVCSLGLPFCFLKGLISVGVRSDQKTEVTQLVREFGWLCIVSLLTGLTWKPGSWFSFSISSRFVFLSSILSRKSTFGIVPSFPSELVCTPDRSSGDHFVLGMLIIHKRASALSNKPGLNCGLIETGNFQPF